MSYQEKKCLVSILSSTVVFWTYCLYAYQKYGKELFGASASYRLWGILILVLVPLSILANSMIRILFNILYRITAKEEEPSFADERDKFIELKADRSAHYLFVMGFLLAMGSLALGGQPAIMFLILVFAGFIADITGSILRFFYYGRGF